MDSRANFHGILERGVVAVNVNPPLYVSNLFRHRFAIRGHDAYEHKYTSKSFDILSELLQARHILLPLLEKASRCWS